MSNYLSLRRQMDQFMNDLWTTHPSFYGSHSFNSLFNDPFFNNDDSEDTTITLAVPVAAVSVPLGVGGVQDKDKDKDNNKNEANSNANNNNNTQLSNNNQDKDSKNINTQVQANNKAKVNSNSLANRLWPSSIMHCDIHEENDKFVIQAELPGVAKNDLNVSVENGVLSIKGSKASSQQTDENKQGVKIHRSERSFGSFQRAFTLPNNTDPDPKNYLAKFENGLLTLSLPKKIKSDESAKQTITIQ